MPCSFVPPCDQPQPATVAVRRSGGFARVVRSGAIGLEGPEVRLLLSQPNPLGLPQPDRFPSTVGYGVWQLSVPEPDLTAELRRVVSIVLSGDQPRGLGSEPGSI